MEVTGKSSLRRLLSGEPVIGEVIDGHPKIYLSPNVASSQQAAVADALTSMGILWNLAMYNTTAKGHGRVLDHLDAVHTIDAGYYQPYTSVVCKHDSIDGANDTDPIAFPAYSGVGAQTEGLNSTHLDDRLLFHNITKGDAFNTTGSLAEYRLRWVELPFNGTAIGAMILKPRSPQNATQDLLMCSIGAGWGLSLMNTSTSTQSAEPVLSQVDTKTLINELREFTRGPAYYLGASPEEDLASMHQEFYYSPIFPQRPVLITKDWANFLNPTISYLNTTVFASLMGLDTSLHELGQAEIILSEMLANGLSRIGSTSQLQGIVKQRTQQGQPAGLDGGYWFAGKGNNVFQVDPAESQDWVKFRVSSTVEGYSYNTHGATPKVAICLLLIYCVVVIIHITYASVSGISSTCWDSIGEVTALAMNSTPTVLLRNTWAGITELDIFKLPVRVLAFADAEGDGEHLELVFGSLDENMVKNKSIMPNRVYGTMPGGKVREKTD